MLRTALTLVGIAAGVYLIGVTWTVVRGALDILTIFFTAWLVAAGIRRLAGQVRQRTRAPFPVAVGVSYTVVVVPAVAVIAVGLPLIVGQLVQLARSLPALLTEAPALLTYAQSVADFFGLGIELDEVYREDIRTQVSALVSFWVRDNAFSFAQRTAIGLLRVAFVAGLSFYLVFDWNRLGVFVHRLTPERWHQGMENSYAYLEQIFFRWLLGILTIAVLFGAATFIVMSLAGLPFALPIAVLAGLLVIMPYIGDALAIGLPASIALLDGATTTALWVGATLAIIDVVIINLVISPRLMGTAVRLPSALVLISVIVWSKLLGPLGSFVGVPVGGFLYFSALAVAEHLKGRTTSFADAESIGHAMDLDEDDENENDAEASRDERHET